jgi:hypothetical protein
MDQKGHGSRASVLKKQLAGRDDRGQLLHESKPKTSSPTLAHPGQLKAPNPPGELSPGERVSATRRLWSVTRSLSVVLDGPL